ncbi:hypothetical protein [Paraburkholderia sp. A1RO-1]|uniref:hypothetical protein n=1 Tax=unclassified Paraburkholderia TaxID=2615204 RepID=UPI003B7F7B2B
MWIRAVCSATDCHLRGVHARIKLFCRHAGAARRDVPCGEVLSVHPEQLRRLVQREAERAEAHRERRKSRQRCRAADGRQARHDLDDFVDDLTRRGCSAPESTLKLRQIGIPGGSQCADALLHLVDRVGDLPERSLDLVDRRRRRIVGTDANDEFLSHT